MKDEKDSDKSFTYKLQWKFPIQASLFDSELTLQKKLYSFLRIIRGENITSILFEDCDGELLPMHTIKNLKVFGEEFATKRAIHYIKKTIKKDGRVFNIILIRE